MKVYAENNRARFDYEVVETIEAGIELKGFEVKSVKSDRATIAGSFATLKGGEAFLLGTDIPPYQPHNTPEGYDQHRTRKLLLKREDIEYLERKMQSDRLTLVPIKLYNKAGLVKVELALARGRKKSDKRELIKKRETDREIRRTLKR
jgi:SsrA-binding protein